MPNGHSPTRRGGTRSAGVTTPASIRPKTTTTTSATPIRTSLPCIDSDNPYDTPIGVYSRGDDCEPIDPLTESRSHINPHYPWSDVRLDLIDSMGSAYKPQPFTLEQVRILQAPMRVCYRMPPEGPWVAAAPVGPFDHPGLVYCWASLGTGLWDLSDWTVGTVDVSFTGATASPWGLDDLQLG